MSKVSLIHCNGGTISGGSSQLETGEMYRLKPLYDGSAPIELPTTMYKLNSVYKTCENTSKQNIVVATPSSKVSAPILVNGEHSAESIKLEKKKTCHKKSYAESNNAHDYHSLSNGGITLEQLERRQLTILTRLDLLRLEVDRLLDKRRSVSSTGVVSKQCTTAAAAGGPTVSNTSAASARLKSLGISTSSTIDLVLNADPTSPPLSLFVLFELLRRQFSVLPVSYVHSTLSLVKDSKLVSSVSDVFHSVSSGAALDRSKYQLGFTVIWKQKGKRTTSLTVGSTQRSPIVGESNIARFLARLLDESFYDDENDIIKATQIDDIIDIAADSVTRSNDASRLLSVLEPLNTRSWILGTMSLADIVVWSALKQGIGKEGGKEASLPVYVRRWMENCSQRQEFLIVKRLIK